MPEKRYKFEELSSFNTNVNQPQRYSFSDLSKPKTPLEDSFLDEWMPDWIKRGYNESITGMAEKIVTGEERFNLDNYKPTILGDIGSAVAGFLMPADLAATFAGAGIASLATRAAAKTALKKAAMMGSKRLISLGSSKQFSDKVMNAGAKKLLSGTATQAGALSTYTGLNEALKQEIDEGEIDWSSVLTESSKAALSGAVGGAIFGRAIARGAKTSSALAQEAIGFGTADPILRGEIPTPEDYLSGLGVVLGISAAKALPKAAKKYVKGVTDEYTGNKLDPENTLSTVEKNSMMQVAHLAATQEWLAKQTSQVWNTIPNIKGSYIPEVRILEEVSINIPSNKKLYNKAKSDLNSLMGKEVNPTVEQIKNKYLNLYKNDQAKKLKSKPGDIQTEDAFKDVPGFKLQEEGGRRELKLSRKEFYSTYKSNPIVRQNAEQLASTLKQSLKLSDDVFSQELGSSSITNISDSQLREVNKRLYNRHKVETHYKTFKNHSAECVLQIEIELLEFQGKCLI